MATVQGSFENCVLGSPLPLLLWKTTVTVAAGATTASIEPSNKVSGTVVAVWIDPTTLAAAATIKGYAQNDGLTTPDYFLNYTVPNPAVEARLGANTRVFGKPQIDVASAVAADSFVLYVWVMANGNSVDATAPQNMVANSTKADQALTVDATEGGVQFAAFDEATTHVFLDCQGYDIRFTLDNSAPTTTNGHIMQDGQSAIWAKSLAAAAKFIRDGDSSAVLHASQLRLA